MSGSTDPGRRTDDSFEEINSPQFLEKLSAKNVEGQRAFARLVRVTHDRFLGFIRRQLSSPEECQEVLQEVYLATHKGLAGFAGKSKLTTWMFSLAHHKICDRLSDRARRHHELTEAHAESLSTDTGDDRWEGITAWDASVERVSARNAVEALVGKAIATLPETSRQVYHLRDVEGLSGEEVGVILGITPENVRVQLHRARKHIVEWVHAKMEQGKNAEQASKPGVAT